MENSFAKVWQILLKPFCFIIVAILFFTVSFSVFADTSVPQTDQTPLSPLTSPSPSTAWPRYISGFGSDNNYTIFYEDRNDIAGCSNPQAFRIYYNQTTTGAMGFSAASTATDICDTHFTVKNWPISISGFGSFAYRGWGAHGNDQYHEFYVSNNLVNWIQIYSDIDMFNDPDNIADSEILYGFHDIVKINNNYMGFVESAGGQTYIAWSDNGDEDWTIKAKVGGIGASDSPLNMRFTSSISGTIPTGNFILMMVDGQLAYGKLMVPGNRSGAYLAINRVAAQAATPALAEAAFLNPGNWTWRDGTTGLPGAANAVLLSTIGSGGHDIREVFSAPISSSSSDSVILYTGNYSSGALGHGIGCASSSTDCLVIAAAPITKKTRVPTSTPTTDLLFTFDGLPIPITGFTPGHSSQLPSIKPSYQGTNLRLIIPSLDINQEIVGVPQTDSGWDTSWLGHQIGYLNGTAFPTWNGNSVLTGHVYDADGLPGIFLNLETLKWGDQIIVQLSDQNYIYEVRQVKTILPTDSTFVFNHESIPWLTLVTCKGYDEKIDRYLFRTAVKAVLIKVEPTS